METLIDTSVWIDFFNGTNNTQVVTLEKLLLNGDACTCPVVLMEVLQGIRSDKICQNTEKLLSSLALYEINTEHYLEAAQLFRCLRKQGLTIRKSLDCLIATVAIQNQLPILHRDRDFTAIARHTKLVCLPVEMH